MSVLRCKSTSSGAIVEWAEYKCDEHILYMPNRKCRAGFPWLSSVIRAFLIQLNEETNSNKNSRDLAKHELLL